MSKGGLQHMNIPLEEEINKEEEASNDFKEEDLGIQASEEEKAPVELREQANYADEDAIISGYIADVYYIPVIKHNMLSIGQLLEKGYTLFMKYCHVPVKDNNGRLIVFVKMSKNRMFTLNIQFLILLGSFDEDASGDIDDAPGVGEFLLLNTGKLCTGDRGSSYSTFGSSASTVPKPFFTVGDDSQTLCCIILDV
ncbi:hypothetical protein DKX38_015533 [Salix brachista]|uniref:Uncharacterized protein n=1 Tax=Salix brachista TaxID=2182728 RepID=A0A5N5L5U9_9ROSI|nr:hypothetical protein DKX38_015533 [Salix brachista]